MNNGLYAVPGFCPTCTAAARASWLLLPSTKLSNVKVALSRLPSTRGAERVSGSGAAETVAGAAARRRLPTSSSTLRAPACSAHHERISTRQCACTQSTTKRFGASSLTTPSPSSTGCSGLIHVLSCCSDRADSNAPTHCFHRDESAGD